MPVGEHPGFTTGNVTQPMFGKALMPSKPLVFPHGPFYQPAIEMA